MRRRNPVDTNWKTTQKDINKINTIRYKNDDSLIYVGSTVQRLYKLLSQRKKDSKIPKHENIQLHVKMNETDVNDWYIELHEDCSCERRELLSQREGQVNWRPI